MLHGSIWNKLILYALPVAATSLLGTFLGSANAVLIPARLVAVYAPGLDPMDFHAVVEADVDGTWRVVDATRLAPLPSLVRICSGRDAADTAFLTTLGGVARGVGDRLAARRRGMGAARGQSGPALPPRGRSGPSAALRHRAVRPAPRHAESRTRLRRR